MLVHSSSASVARTDRARTLTAHECSRNRINGVRSAIQDLEAKGRMARALGAPNGTLASAAMPEEKVANNAETRVGVAPGRTPQEGAPAPRTCGVGSSP